MPKPSHVYVERSELARIAQGLRGRARVWRVRTRPVAAQLGMVVYHSRDCFDDLDDVELAAMVAANESQGGNAPGSYGSIWRTVWKRDRKPPPGVNGVLRGHVIGPWQQAIARPRTVVKPAQLWDLKSAYAWAGLQGLPDPNTYQPATLEGPWKIAYAHIALHDVCGPFPPGLTAGTQWALVTREEIEAYQAEVFEIRCGITWHAEERQRFADAFGLIDDVYGAKVGKRVRQAYWGLWAATSPLECQVAEGGKVLKSWNLNSWWEDAVRAHIVQSRVRVRMYQALKTVRGPARVYVDSVLCESAPFTPGTKPGDWGHVRTWEGGVEIKHAGMYVDPTTGEILSGRRAKLTA